MVNKIRFLFFVALMFSGLSCGENKKADAENPTAAHKDTINPHKDSVKKAIEAVPKPEKTASCDCDVAAFEEDRTKKITIYPTPSNTGGKTIYLGEPMVYFHMTLIAAQPGWLCLGKIYESDGSINNEFKKYRNWWIPAGQVFLSTSDICCDLRLFRNPADTAETIGYYDGLTMPVLSCSGKWVKLQGKAIKGKTDTTGWVPFEVMCMNIFTNCCQEIPKKYRYKNHFE